MYADTTTLMKCTEIISYVTLEPSAWNQIPHRLFQGWLPSCLSCAPRTIPSWKNWPENSASYYHRCRTRRLADSHENPVGHDICPQHRRNKPQFGRKHLQRRHAARGKSSAGSIGKIGRLYTAPPVETKCTLYTQGNFRKNFSEKVLDRHCIMRLMRCIIG